MALVAWDVDDVLNDLTLEWASRNGVGLNTLHPPTGDPATWMATYDFENAEYLTSLDKFRSESYESLNPNPLVQDLLERWPNQSDTHMALTATPLFAQSIVAEWTIRHFGRWLRGVWFCPSPRSSDPPGMPVVSKGEILARFAGRSVLIDDSVTNLRTVGEPSEALMYPRPWNSPSLRQGLTDFLVKVHRIHAPERDGVTRVDGC